MHMHDSAISQRGGRALGRVLATRHRSRYISFAGLNSNSFARLSSPPVTTVCKTPRNRLRYSLLNPYQVHQLHTSNMPAKTAILTQNAPPPLPGVLSQGIVANGTVYCSGQVAVDPATGKMVEGDIQARTVCSWYPSVFAHSPTRSHGVHMEISARIRPKKPR